MEKNEFLNLKGKFNWNFGNKFFIETNKGNFIWFAPEYGGNNHVKKFNGSLKGIALRDKGIHIIKNYVGSDIILDF